MIINSLATLAILLLSIFTLANGAPQVYPYYNIPPGIHGSISIECFENWCKDTKLEFNDSVMESIGYLSLEGRTRVQLIDDKLYEFIDNSRSRPINIRSSRDGIPTMVASWSRMVHEDGWRIEDGYLVSGEDDQFYVCYQPELEQRSFIVFYRDVEFPPLLPNCEPARLRWDYILY